MTDPIKFQLLSACDICGRTRNVQPDQILCDDCRLFRIALGAGDTLYRVTRREDLGFHVHIDTCPNCDAQAGRRGLLAFVGPSGELYSDCCGLHLGPVERADRPGSYYSYAELRGTNAKRS